jgi:hypothetical protein
MENEPPALSSPIEAEGRVRGQAAQKCPDSVRPTALAGAALRLASPEHVRFHPRARGPATRHASENAKTCLCSQFHLCTNECE